MGAKMDQVMAARAALQDPTYDELVEALTEACHEQANLLLVTNNLAHWLNALAKSYIEKDAWATHDILACYVKNRRPAFPHSNPELH